MNPRRQIRVRLVQMDVRPGRPSDNTARIIEHVRRAGAEGVDLVVFPEMAVPGYLLGDEWEHDAFLRECERCGDDIRVASEGVVAVFGNVGVDWSRRNEDGRVRKYNACFIADHGAFVGPDGAPYDFVVKSLLPNYREFDDSRHFFDQRKLAAEEGVAIEAFTRPVKTSVATLGCILCEDGWDADYAVSPLAILARHGTDLFVNISASPYTQNKNRKRQRVFTAQVRQWGRPMVYVNCVGIQNNGKTVFTFDGASCLYDSHGQSIEMRPWFKEAVLTHDVPLDPGASFGRPIEQGDDDIGVLYTAIDYGTRRFLQACDVDRVTIGVSGGIDSALVAAIYSRILEPDRLLLVNMPGVFNSPTTRGLARSLAERLGCRYADISIQPGVDATRAQLDGLVIAATDGSHPLRLTISDFMLENVQARDRSSRLLAGLSAAFGGVFTCNANKAELTVGYGTLYGDVAGFLANIADLWKMEVYAMARHLNTGVFGREMIPEGSMTIVPSAELSADQNVDEGKGDPLFYAYHDRLFRSWVEWWNRATPEDILRWYAEGQLEVHLEYEGRLSDRFAGAAEFIADLERWWNLYQGRALAKRIQAPPVLAVKRRAFGFDHRESLTGPYYTRAYQELKTRLLG